MERGLAASRGHFFNQELELRVAEANGKKETSGGVADKTDSANLKLESVDGPAFNSTSDFKVAVALLLPDMGIKYKFLKWARQFAPNDCFGHNRRNHDIRAEVSGDASCCGEQEVVVKVDH